MSDARVREVRPGGVITVEALGFTPSATPQVRVVDLITGDAAIAPFTDGVVEASPGNYALALEIPDDLDLGDYADEWDFGSGWNRDDDTIRVTSAIAPADPLIRPVGLGDVITIEALAFPPGEAAQARLIDPLTGDIMLPASAAGIVEASPGNYGKQLAIPSDLDVGVYAAEWLFGGTWYRDDQLIGVVLIPLGQYAPSVDEVATILRARTKTTMGDERGTFNSDTRPNQLQVVDTIRLALRDVSMRVGVTVPTDLVAEARGVVALRAAALIELSYFPEQSADTLTAYQSLRLSYEEAIGKLVSAVQLRGLFSETAPEEVEA